MNQSIYEPILTKVYDWISYMEWTMHMEKDLGLSYQDNPKVFDEYRKTHDLDCILTGGAFEEGFESEADLIEWIKREKLEVLFDGEIRKENVRILAKREKPEIEKPEDILKTIILFRKALEQRRIA